MTKLLRFAPSARADLVGIWDYTARHSEMDQADRYLKELYGICLVLANGEMASRLVDIRPGTRKARTGSHMVYVREGADTLHVIRIVHQRQNVDRTGTSKNPSLNPKPTLRLRSGVMRQQTEEEKGQTGVVGRRIGVKERLSILLSPIISKHGH